MVLDVRNIEALAAELAPLHPADILKRAQQEYPADLAISFSGAEDVVLIDMAWRNKLPFRVFTLDTARLHAQTYRFLDTVREKYAVEIEAYFPQPDAVQQLVRTKGYFSFYNEGHEECCAIRKVEPLRRALAGLRAYVTGQRRDQSPGTRAEIPTVQLDTGFSLPGQDLVKFNPLANWSSGKVWQYIREHEVPYNPLHDIGFRSIGCEPCTRATNPGEHEREGRWWWEEATKRECGIHIINLGNQ
ncbi:MAG: phosphoadenylyl-sulfate reductase [Dehalococcoidia bacterium]|nr:phosphoadenylyl-sulfate reductase [Dehalococcoidia bacterium]